jgi:hypothetical protein
MNFPPILTGMRAARVQKLFQKQATFTPSEWLMIAFFVVKELCSAQKWNEALGWDFKVGIY